MLDNFDKGEENSCTDCNYRNIIPVSFRGPYGLRIFKSASFFLYSYEDNVLTSLRSFINPINRTHEITPYTRPSPSL